MALNNVPLTGQSLSQTRDQIAGNFSVIDAAFSIDHVPYNAAFQGEHARVSMPVQSMIPTFNAGEYGLYNAAGSTGQNEIFLHKLINLGAGTMDIPLAASILSTVGSLTIGQAGWTYLPSGFIIQWQSNMSANGQSANIAFPIPFPNQVLCTMITTAYNGGGSDGNGFVRLNQQAAMNYQVYASSRTSVTPQTVLFNMLAIGY